LALVALVIVGALLLVIGLVAGGSLPFLGLGLLSLMAGGLIRFATSRRS
jgi:hypothetical protein